MSKEGLTPVSAFDDFLFDVNAHLDLSEGTTSGWFGIINPSGLDLADIKARVSQVAAQRGRSLECYEYPESKTGKHQGPWFDLIERTAGQDAPLVLLMPQATDYDSDEAKTEHLYYALQGYGLSVRNRIHETGQGIIIVAPPGLDSEQFIRTYRTVIDLASVMRLFVDLDTAQQ